MAKKIFIFIAVCALVVGVALPLSGCVSVQGTGEMRPHTVELSRSFNAINVSGSFVVHFEYSETESVRFEMQDNIFELVRVNVRDNTLRVDSRRSFTTSTENRPRMYVTAPSLTSARFSGSTRAEGWDKIIEESFELRTSGSSNVNIAVEVKEFAINTSGSSRITAAMEVDELDLRASGSANFTLSGTATELNVRISGSARVEGLLLQTYDTTLSLSGSARVYIAVENTLDVRVSGSARVRYSGRPYITQRISGSGSVQSV